MLQIKQHKQRQGIARRQLGRQHRMEPADHAHEPGKREDMRVGPEAQDAQQDGVEPAEVKRKGAVDGKGQVRVDQRVDQFEDLHAQEGPANGVQGRPSPDRIRPVHQNSAAAPTAQAPSATQ